MEVQFANVDFVKRSRLEIPDNTDRFIFYVICAQMICSLSDTMDIDSLLTNFYSGKEKMDAAQSFINEKNTLLKSGLIEFETKGNLNNSTVRLTEKGEKFLLQEDYDIFEHCPDRKCNSKHHPYRNGKVYRHYDCYYKSCR